ncbi:hypothetical protein RM555_18485 [Micromonospora sp. DSM 115977]|uniref:Uncharacterized protein n=1 Tax=Micromonospora reichwaldensis TaxID=3075516 RepID=A0ABU2WZE6_9ACTN|nr:hypothetical protein [Micromonospora sp. DSM 115977]MDT0530979.1 hypothetical protein [Micromonospora sp. DSM 115977]
MTGVGDPAPAGRRRRHAVRVPLTTRVGRWSANHPWLAITAWLCFVLASVVGGSLVGTVKATTQDSLHGELARADRIEQAGAFPDAPAVESVLITARTGGLDLPRAEAVAADLSTRLRAVPEVARVGDAVTSPSRDAVLIEVEMTGVAKDADARVGPLLEATGQAQQRHPDLRVEQVGSASLSKALTETLAADFVKAELISVLPR